MPLIRSAFQEPKDFNGKTFKQNRLIFFSIVAARYVDKTLSSIIHWTSICEWNMRSAIVCLFHQFFII